MTAKYIALFFIYSLLGWLLELLFTFINTKKYINRGCLIGPYCPIYGFGCILLNLILNKYTNNIIILFIVTFVICTILEYLTSLILEKIFNLRWWDYSRYKYNINGRVCLETMLPFSILGTIVIKYLNPMFINLLDKIPIKHLFIIDIILITIISIDMLFSIYFTILAKKKKKISKKDATEEIKYNTYKEVINKVKKK